jgi:flavin reductase (DIM6/NTAB) family NADH-FMN oxidoreductase RutF
MRWHAICVLFYEPHARDRALLPHDPFKALVAPRPIGWMSTRAADGRVNLAPYSFFNAICDQPPMVVFSSSGLKDSPSFAIESGAFVWNLATYALREAMNESSAEIPRGVNEFERAGLAMADSRLVDAPRVAASPCAFECRVVHTLELHDIDGAATNRHVVIGQVVGVHLDEAAIVDGRVDTAALQPIARCGYLGEYATVTEVFTMDRPTA